MSYDPENGLARAFPLSSKLDFAPDAGAAGPARSARDIKKIVLVTGLGLLSWVATYVGMLELIESNMGDLPLVHKVIIGFSVAMLMTMIVWLLDQMFSPAPLAAKLSYVAGYLFLSLISVGFGFGFYWKVLESRQESTRSAEAAVSQVQGSLHAATTRLEQLNATLVQLAAVSREKAELERTKGTSCPNSRPGDGPRRKMRDEDAARFSFASDFVKGRVDVVKSDMNALNGDLARIASADPTTFDARSGTRNEFMRALSRKLDMTVTGFNAFRTDPQLKQLRADLDDRASKSTFGDPKNGGFVCPDAQLQQALHGAVRAIDQLPELEKPAIAAVEGSEATIEAFRRLTATFYGLLSFKLPPSADELRELQQKAVQSVEGGGTAAHAATEVEAGLSKRDYVPLAIAIFVDICLLLVSIGRPMNRLHGLVPKMREAERGPIIEILSRFNDIHRDREVRESFELFRHVVFDLNGDYYVAVPLDAPPRMNPQQREQLRLEAQLLSNLFASFEKERIFTRTWTPFTRRIQAKLRKQGSKFAESEGFRVYRFRKGAWSEIILGAVMGAARRAEEDRRRRGIDRPVGTAFTQPSSVLPPQGPYEPHFDGASERSGVRRGNAPFEGAMTWSRGRKPENSLSRAHAEPPLSRPSWDEARRDGARGPVAPAETGSRFVGFGTYASSARAELEGARLAEHAAAQRAANNNTSPRLRSATATLESDGPDRGTGPLARVPAKVAAAEELPPVAAEAALQPVPEATIGVVVRRETMTIPVPESVLAQSLPSLLARAASTGSHEAHQIDDTIDGDADLETAAVSQASALPPPIPEWSKAPSQDEKPQTGNAGGAGEQDWGDHDVTIAHRFKPDAA